MADEVRKFLEGSKLPLTPEMINNLVANCLGDMTLLLNMDPVALAKDIPGLSPSAAGAIINIAKQQSSVVKATGDNLARGFEFKVIDPRTHTSLPPSAAFIAAWDSITLWLARQPDIVSASRVLLNSLPVSAKTAAGNIALGGMAKDQAYRFMEQLPRLTISAVGYENLGAQSGSMRAIAIILAHVAADFSGSEREVAEKSLYFFANNK